jgi:hypothetical protein
MGLALYVLCLCEAFENPKLHNQHKNREAEYFHKVGCDDITSSSQQNVV